ncbi:MAG: sulfite exporter TauE/SafE family protein [Verrucomicrobia bacterium]|nr:sulfite exporter TauE/SafE family protein [Verrucomicrobiota bacterium]
MIAILTGLVAGLGHVFSGPDHLAAVAPLAVESRKKAWAAGLRWGLGHTSGVLIVGVLFVFLKDLLPTELISSWSERLVGVVLIGIGLWGFRTALKKRIHVHEHSHGGPEHAHVHVHDSTTAHKPAEPRRHVHTHTAFAVGTLHGLAGSSHLLGVLPALTFATRQESFSYLGAFGVGNILAMIAFAGAIGLISRGFADRGVRGYQYLMYACSVAAMGVGVYWLVAPYFVPAASHAG